MRYLKITLRRESGKTKLVYPENYQEELGNYNFQHKGHLYYNDENDNPMLILSIADDNWKESMVRQYVEEITETDAKTISEANETRTEQIVNEVKLRRIELKVNLGQTLTQEEEDAMDPEKPNSVFETTKILADKIEDHKVIEINLAA